MNSIVAVIVTHNRKELLKKNIECLLRQSYAGFDIFVIDNASTDSTEEMIKNDYSENTRIQYFNTGANMGGAGGFSFGIRKGLQTGYEYIWAMDDDTMPEENALSELVNAGKSLNDDFGFLASYVKWTDNGPCEMNVPGISDAWRENISFEFENQMMRLKSASFVSLLLKSEVLYKVGLPIKEFFIWGDDLEYTLRIAEKHPSYLVYKSQVVHEMKSNNATSILDDSEERLGRYHLCYRNRYYIARHGAKRDLLLYFLLIKNTIRDLKNSDLPDKKKRIAIVKQGVREGRKFNPAVEYVENPNN